MCIFFKKSVRNRKGKVYFLKNLLGIEKENWKDQNNWKSVRNRKRKLERSEQLGEIYLIKSDMPLNGRGLEIFHPLPNQIRYVS